MHLIQSLASGIVGAANGRATLLKRGSSTPVTYYLDFEATQPVTGTASGIALDANGAAIIYVNEITTVTVLDVNGAQIRQFTAADEAPAVEVISQSFTGTSYSDGSSGTGKPTTLQVVLDAWLTSAGSPDFKVTASGVVTTIQAAIASITGLFFSVKAYGAIGDGAADDGAAITAAIAAAAATPGPGGIVFFPPGKYRSTTAITVSGGVSVWGCGATASQLSFDSAVLANGLIFPGGGGGQQCLGLLVTTINSNYTGNLVLWSGGQLTIADCLLGGSATTKGKLISATANGLDKGTHCVVERCQFSNNADVSLVTQTGTGRLSIRNSGFSTYAGAYNQNIVNTLDGVLVDNCLFDASAATSGTMGYIGYTATGSWGGCVFVNNRFRSSVATVTALVRTGGIDQNDCYEGGNSFGDNAAGLVTPYGSSIGFNSLVSSALAHGHHSRIGRVFCIASDAATLSVPSDQYDSVFITRTSNVTQTLNFAKGIPGDKLMLMVQQTGGANNNELMAANVLMLSSTTVLVTTLHQVTMLFQWMPNVAKGGAWAQLAATGDVAF